MESCVKCERTEDKVKLLDAIYGGEIMKICETCLHLEDIPVIRKPTTFQLKESERNPNVYERLREKGLGSSFSESEKKNLTIDSLRGRVHQKKLNPENNIPLDLVDNFNWVIMMARRKSGLTHKQLGDKIGESESVLKMAEQGRLPDDELRLIRKLEGFLSIKLRKGDSDAMKYVKPPIKVVDSDLEINPKIITLSDLIRVKKEKQRQIDAESKEVSGEKAEKIIDQAKENLEYRKKKKGGLFGWFSREFEDENVSKDKVENLISKENSDEKSDSNE